jgi:hypothetical protein
MEEDYMKKSILGLLLLGLHTLLFGADLSGHWTVKAKDEGRERSLELALTQRGNTLTGNVTGKRGDYPITKGSLDDAGNIEILVGGKKGALAGAKITGKVDGDQLRLTSQTKKGQGEAIASKTQ